MVSGRTAGTRQIPTKMPSVAESHSQTPDPGPDTSLDLLRRAQAGDSEALNALIARYLPCLLRWATGRLPAEARVSRRFHAGGVYRLLVSGCRTVSDEQTCRSRRVRCSICLFRSAKMEIPEIMALGV